MKNQTHNSIKPDDPGPAKGVKRGLIAVAALAVLAAVYAGIWFLLAGQIRDGIDQWAADRRAEGFGVEYGPIAVFGFPFLFETVIVNPVLTAPGEHGFRSWQGPIMIMQARPWALSKVRMLAFGRHRVTTMTGGKPKTIDIEFGSLIAALDFSPAGASFAVNLNASDIAYPHAPVTGLGRTTKRLNVSVAVKGDIPRTRNAETMARWRDNGGTIEVSNLDIGHGPLDLTVDGTGALDADLQPIGAFSLNVRGFNEAIDRLRVAGIIKPNTAALMKTVLGMLAQGQKDKSATEDADMLKVPLSLQYRKVYLGPVAVAEMPVVRWPPSR
jgi:hypothetical protein